MGHGLAWFGVGNGTSSVGNPKDQVDSVGILFIDGGFEGRLLGPLIFSLGINASLSSGKLQYNYKGSDNITYQGSDVTYYMTLTALQLGLGLRLIETKWFHVFAVGGGFAGSADLGVQAVDNAQITAAGTKYLSEQKSILATGLFAEAGLDFLGKSFGLRFAGRLARGSTDPIEVLNKKKIEFIDAAGYIAVIKVL